MTALSDNANRTQKAFGLVNHPVVASDIIYKDALVKHNAAGYLSPCVAEAGAVFAGIAYEQVDNSAGSAGAKECKAIKSGVWEMAGSGLTQADVGSVVYAQDDNSVSVTDAGNQQACGRITKFISATLVEVQIDGYAF